MDPADAARLTGWLSNRCPVQIIEVNFHLGEDLSQSPLGTTCTDAQDFFSNPHVVTDLLMQHARAITGEQAVARLVYKDEENDWCTVTQASLSDAADFAKPVSLGAHVGKLDLRIIVDENFSENDFPVEQEPSQGKAEMAGEDVRSSTADNSEALLIEAVQTELNGLAPGIDLNTLLPKLAAVGLRLIQECSEPALLECIACCIEPLLAIREGEVQAEALPQELPRFFAIKEKLSTEALAKLLQRFREEAKKVVGELQEKTTKDQEQHASPWFRYVQALRERREDAGRPRLAKQEKMRPPQAQARDNREVVEVHLQIVCDACNAAPILGRRYKSLAHEDYDLCQKCFDEFERDAHLWVRVASEVTCEANRLSFPVVIEDGRNLKIEWERGEDPQKVAKRFANTNRIMPDEFQTIVDFVTRANAAMRQAQAVQAKLEEATAEEDPWANYKRPEERQDGRQRATQQPTTAAEPKVFRRSSGSSAFGAAGSTAISAAFTAAKDLLLAPPRAKPRCARVAPSAAREVAEEQGTSFVQAEANNVEEESTACSSIEAHSDAQQSLQSQLELMKELELMKAQLKEALDRATAAEEATKEVEKAAAQARASLVATKKAEQEVEFATSRTSNSRAEHRETRAMAQMDDCQSLVSASTTSDVFPAKAHRPRQEDVQSYVSASATSELRPQEVRSRATESATSDLFPQGSGSATSELFPQDFQSYVSGSVTSESRLQDAQSYVSGSAMSELRPQDHRDHFTRPRGQRSDAGHSKASSSYQRSDAGNSRTSSSTHSNAGKKGASFQASQAHRVCPGGELRPVPGGELRPPTPSKRGNTPRSAHTPSQASRPTFSPKPRSDADWLADSVSGNKMDRSCSVASTSICGSESSISEAWGGASVCASTSA